MLPTDLPGDLPGFLKRFGTDAQCREYLCQARWPEGFGCAVCGHDRAWPIFDSAESNRGDFGDQVIDFVGVGAKHKKGRSAK